MKRPLFLLILFLVVGWSSCMQKTDSKAETALPPVDSTLPPKSILTGADQLALYLPLLKDKRVAMVVNQSALVDSMHLVDLLLEKQVHVVKIFAPEHGFRGNVDRGKHIDNTMDKATGLPIVSMFGKNKRPSLAQLADVDVVIFDIQDVGVRFFTYISSMHEVMNACAESQTPLLVLDRPNPLGDYVDGPIRQKGYQSFVGMHPIPVVHGLTVGELARMINGEKWLDDGRNCELTVITMKNYTHDTPYSLPIKPSPNLPNDLSIRLYPSLCFFEATRVSIGRGTQFPFQVVGFPNYSDTMFSFIPQDIAGMQINPLHENKTCYGIDLRNEELSHRFTLKYIIEFYEQYGDGFFSRSEWFNLLAGNKQLLEQIKSGMSEAAIRETWQAELTDYKQMRMNYLLYK